MRRSPRLLGVLLLALLNSLPLSAAPADWAPDQDLPTRIRALEAEAYRISSACGGDSAIAPVYAELAALYAHLPQDSRRGGNALDQGGDACNDARIINGIPFCDAGTTHMMGNDYTPPAACGFSQAPDVVYYFHPTTTVTASVSLCGSSFNTILHIWQDCPGTATAQLICCNDNAPACGLQSCCPQVTFVAGQTYYIVVDGANFEDGDYVLHVGPAGSCPSDVCPPCVVTCPAGALPEGEICPTGWPDTYNAGCYWYPFAATPLGCGQTICGKAQWDASGVQDHDAYIVTITQRDSLRWCVKAEFDVDIALHQYFSGG